MVFYNKFIKSLTDSSEYEEETLEMQRLPMRSKPKYLKCYNNFRGWLTAKNKDTFSEQVLLAYFKHLAQTKLPTTLWNTYSLIKSMLIVKHNVYINSYEKLLKFLKTLSIDHRPRSSQILNAKDIETFLKEAPDLRYIVHKVSTPTLKLFYLI